MELYKNIKALRIKMNLSQEELARRTGYTSRSSIAKIEAGEVDLSQSKILEFARVFNVTPTFLMGWESDFENDDTSPLTKKEQILNSIKLYDNPVSAGRGAWLDDGCEYSFEEIDKPPVDADFALRVRGDSMSPLYNDDDVVFVKSNVLVEQGQVGVFLLNSEGYLKQWQGNKLVSLNSEYDPIFITDEDEFRVIGKVVRKR